MIVLFYLVMFIAFSLQINPPTAKAQSSFPDMPSFGQEEINRLAKDAILKGNPDGTLRPHAPVTRAEAMTMIGRALNLAEQNGETPFSDVPANHFASGYISSGAALGIIKGTGEGTFEPSRTITRAEMAIILTRAFELTSTRPDVIYRDVNANTFGAYAINVITTARISAGYPDGSFAPKNGTSRVEFSLFLSRAIYPEFKLPEYEPRKDVLEANITRAVVYNASGGLNVRSGPSTSDAIVGKLQNGDSVNYFNTSGNWAVFTFEGKTAYVSLSYLHVPSTSSSNSVTGKVIVLDPGHGGKDPGAVSFGVRESDVVLSVGLKLKKKLENAGATVVMTREKDVFLELSERVAIANNKKADVFVSIHANAAASSSANGTETFWNNLNAGADSKKLAEEIQKELISKLKTRDRGAKEGNFHVVKNAKMAAVLVELGFLTNEAEAKKLATSSFQEDAAEAIYQGIVKFYK